MPRTYTRSSRVRAAVLLCAVASVFVYALTSACRSRAPAIAGVPDVVDFNFHVRPILSDRCFKCHGPDDRARKASLRLDLRDGAFNELPSGRRAVVAGRPGRSELVRRVTSSDPKVMMPTPDSHLALSDAEKATLVRWVEQGAEWKTHWAFTPPRRIAPPQVRTEGWARNEIDRFVLATLEARGLQPSREAGRETLLRRVTFDLTGLPPTIDEIDRFLADRSPQAFERVVDGLLASPRYGEHMAAEWLDIARYADSHGYQDDGMRSMWPWRDWVISAFNRNLPVDQFITWQLAGDLLPDATDEQRLATGFNRNHMQSQEGGIVSEEYRTEYVIDRVNTFGKAFLGVSTECARCHDHKYDPLTQKEYYRLYAFFNNVNETGQIPYSGVPSPTVIVRNPSADAMLAAIRARTRALETETRADNAAFDRGYTDWLTRMSAAAATSTTRAAAAPHAPGATRAASAASAATVAIAAIATPPGLIAHLPLDEAVHGFERTKPDPKSGEKPKLEPIVTYANLATPRARGKLGGDKDRLPKTIPGRIGQAQTLVGDSSIAVGEKEKVAFFERNQPFSLGIWIRIEQPGAEGPLVTRSGGVMNGERGYEILLRKDGTLTAGLHHVAPDNSVQLETTRPIEPRSWHHVALTYDGSSRAAGVRLFLDGRPIATRVIRDHLQRSIVYAQNRHSHGAPPPLRIGRRHDETLQDVSVDDFRVYDRQLTTFEAARLGGVADPLGDALSTPDPQRSPDQRAALREQYLLREDRAFARAFDELSSLRGQENDLLTSLTEVMVMNELPAPRPTFMLARGAYDAPTERVTPGTPHALGDFPAALPQNRLGLARWLLSPSHPLTARVFVNRYWALLFGRGIVATPADFGSQGRLPTHPDLLDWLATDLVQSGWDLKALQKRIVMSATYRQSSIADPARLAQDPQNEWLGRGPASRLAAEQIRDGALAAGGLLVRDVGGPSVYPYQPSGLWEALATRNATSYEQGHGDALYRRSLYTVWKRSSPPPGAISFDAAERLFCTVGRQRTSTPLQALVLLNDPQYVEAARAIADRMMEEGGATVRDRIAFAFRLVTSRHPRAEEVALLERLYRDEHEGFARDPKAADELLHVGEHPRDEALDVVESAAYTVVANTLLSFDEAIVKR